MKKKLAALLTLVAMLLVMLPVYHASADMSAEQMGNGGLVLDTDPAGGYEGDYGLIYNPATSSYTSYSTGDMTGLIETAPDPYAETLPIDDPDGVNTIIDVDAQIAAIDAERREITSKTDALKAEQNNASREIPRIKKRAATFPPSWRA